MSLVQFEHVAHILVGHGDSDKISSVSRAVRLYDEVWVAGQAQADRLESAAGVANAQLIRVVGRPAARDLLRLAINEPRYRVGHMPTWEGIRTEHDYSSVAMLRSLIDSSLRVTAGPLVVKVHPWTGHRDKSLRSVDSELRAQYQASGSVHVETRDADPTSVMGNAGYLVTDVSSVAIDFLLTTRPLFTHISSRAMAQIRPGRMDVSEYAYTFKDPAGFEKRLAGVAAGDDPKATARVAARDYHIDVTATTGHAFERSLGALADLEYG